MPDPMDPPSLEMSPNSFNVVASAVQSSGLYANSEENEEPAWLSDAYEATAQSPTSADERRAERAVRPRSAIEEEVSVDVNEALAETSLESPSRLTESASSVASIDVASIELPVSRMRSSDNEEPAWLSHAAASVDLELGGARCGVAFSKAVDASRAAFDEVRSLTAAQLSDGLLALSAKCTVIMRAKLARGISASAEAGATVLAATSEPAPPSARLRALAVSVGSVHWHGVMQLPLAAVFAFLAVMHTVLAMLITAAVHTPRAARELRAYAADAAERYGVGTHSNVGQHTLSFFGSMLVRLHDAPHIGRIDALFSRMGDGGQRASDAAGQMASDAGQRRGAPPEAEAEEARPLPASAAAENV